MQTSYQIQPLSGPTVGPTGGASVHPLLQALQMMFAQGAPQMSSAPAQPQGQPYGNDMMAKLVGALPYGNDMVAKQVGGVAKQVGGQPYGGDLLAKLVGLLPPGPKPMIGPGLQAPGGMQPALGPGLQAPPFNLGNDMIPGQPGGGGMQFTTGGGLQAPPVPAPQPQGRWRGPNKVRPPAPKVAGPTAPGGGKPLGPQITPGPAPTPPAGLSPDWRPRGGRGGWNYG